MYIAIYTNPWQKTKKLKTHGAKVHGKGIYYIMAKSKAKTEMTVQQVEQAKLTFKPTENGMSESVKSVVNAVSGIMRVAEVQTIADASFLVNTAFQIGDKFSLAVCKVFQKVKKQKLFEPHYKTFVEWAEKCHGVKKVTAYNYAKVGELVDESGQNSILPRASENYDFNYSQLVIIIENLVAMDKKTGDVNANDLEYVKELCEKGELYPNMTRDDLKKKLKQIKDKLSGNLIDLDETSETETSETETSETETSETETTETETTEKPVKLSLSRDEVKELYELAKKAKKDVLMSKLYTALGK